MLIIYREGICLKCGSHKIKHTLWVNICEECNYFEARESRKEIERGNIYVGRET